MQLHQKILKEFSRIDRPYTINYRKGKASYIETNTKDVKIFNSSQGVCMKVNGMDIQLNDLDSLKHLLVKFNLISKSSKINKINKKEDLCELLTESTKQFTAEYYKGELLSLDIEEANIKIKKTSAGYCIQMGKGLIAAEDIDTIKKLLIKMDIIAPKIKEKAKKKMKKDETNEIPGVEQLTLDI